MIDDQNQDTIIPAELVCNVEKRFVQMEVTARDSISLKNGHLEDLVELRDPPPKDTHDTSVNRQTSEEMSDVTVDMSISTSGSVPLPKTIIKTIKIDSSSSLPAIKRRIPRKSKAVVQSKLFAGSSAHSLEGKQRRLEVEKAIKERNAARNGEAVKNTGKIPLSRASSMYKRGIEGLKVFNERISKEKDEQTAKELKMMRDHGKISIERSNNMYDQGIKFKKRIERMQKEVKDKREADAKNRLNPAFTGKISLDDANRTYKRLLKHKKPQYNTISE